MTHLTLVSTAAAVLPAAPVAAATPFDAVFAVTHADMRDPEGARRFADAVTAVALLPDLKDQVGKSPQLRSDLIGQVLESAEIAAHYQASLGHADTALHLLRAGVLLTKGMSGAVVELNNQELYDSALRHLPRHNSAVETAIAALVPVPPAAETTARVNTASRIGLALRHGASNPMVNTVKQWAAKGRAHFRGVDLIAAAAQNNNAPAAVQAAPAPSPAPLAQVADTLMAVPPAEDRPPLSEERAAVVGRALKLAVADFKNSGADRLKNIAERAQKILAPHERAARLAGNFNGAFNATQGLVAMGRERVRLAVEPKKEKPRDEPHF